MGRHILIAVVYSPTSDTQTFQFQVGRAGSWDAIQDRWQRFDDPRFHSKATYTVAGLPVGHFAVRSTNDTHDWRMKGLIPVRQRDVITHPLTR